MIKHPNGGLELCGAKELPPDQPAELEVKIGNRTAQFTLQVIKKRIKLFKDRFHFEEEALDPEWGIRIN